MWALPTLRACRLATGGPALWVSERVSDKGITWPSEPAFVAVTAETISGLRVRPVDSHFATSKPRRYFGPEDAGIDRERVFRTARGVRSRCVMPATGSDDLGDIAWCRDCFVQDRRLFHFLVMMDAQRRECGHVAYCGDNQ